MSTCSTARLWGCQRTLWHLYTLLSRFYACCTLFYAVLGVVFVHPLAQIAEPRVRCTAEASPAL